MRTEQQYSKSQEKSMNESGSMRTKSVFEKEVNITRKKKML